jgi:DNA-binding winged helix-turn-helix (wHTH) protein/Flp pilus assembly protein TadD
MTEEIGSIYRFGPFSLDPHSRTLFRDDQLVTLRPKLFDLLLFLVQHPGKLLQKDELMENVWTDSFVEEANLVQSIAVLRKILSFGNNAGLIKTIPKKGYIFSSDVEIVAKNNNLSEKNKISLAILPFKYSGSNSSTLFLSIGLPDALISKFSSVSDLVVRQTPSIRKFEGLDIDPVDAGKQLHVNFILIGNIEREYNRFKLRLELIDVVKNSLKWHGEYEFGLNDSLIIQDKVCEVIFNVLLPESERDKKRLLKRFTKNLEANQLYLKGRYFWNKRTKADFETAIELFEQAIEIDPDYALPYTGIADSYNLLSGYCFLSPHEARSKARSAVMKALEIDDSLGEAYASLGQIKLTYEYNWLEAELNFQQAVTLSPNYATAYHWLALLLRAKGLFEDALFLLNKARTLEPFSLSINTAYALTFYYSRQYEKAIEESYRVLELNPHYHVAHCTIGLAYEQMDMLDNAIEKFELCSRLSIDDSEILSLLGQAYGLAGRIEDAQSILNKLDLLSLIQYVSPMHLASVYTGLGDKDKAVDLIESAIDERDIEVFQLGITPRFDSLRDHPKFKRLLYSLKLANVMNLQSQSVTFN